MAVPIGPCWAQPSFADDTWAANTWGAAATIAPTVPDVHIGAGSNTGSNDGFTLYAAMRAAETQRKGDEKPIESLVAEPPALIVVPRVVERPKQLEKPRRVIAIEPVELEPEGTQERITALQSAIPVEPSDFGPSLVPELDVVEPELFVDSALDGIRTRRIAAIEREADVVRRREQLFEKKANEPVRQVSPVAHAAQLAQAQRLAIEEEELAYVLLIAA